MQIYALDSKGALTSSLQAEKHFDYHCLECKGALRLRGGSHRRLHFYHIDPAPSCRLNGKSPTHLAIQYALQNLLTEEDCSLEHPFPTIGRIADVVWHSKKIVIEVQCSPIQASEIEGRIKDYTAAGYTMIWILHERSFNHRRVTGAEGFLRKYTFFYTDMDEEGRGSVYLQESLVKGGIRVSRASKVPIDIRTVNPVPYKQDRSSIFTRLSLIMSRMRLKKWR
jgi:competence protein CoiA